MSYDTNTSVSFWVASEVGLWSFIRKSIWKQNLCPVKLTWRVKAWIGVFTLIPEKKVNFEQDQLWEKEAKSASRSGGRKEARREGARPLSRGFQVWDVNFLNYMFSFCFSFRYTAFLSVSFCLLSRIGICGSNFLVGTFISPMGCCHFQPESSGFLFSEIRNLIRFVYIKRFQPTIQFSWVIRFIKITMDWP